VQVTRATFIPLLASGNAERLAPDAVMDDFCSDLNVVYTFGPQFGRRVVTHADLDQMQLPMPVLRRSAYEHLEVLSSRAEFHGQPPALMLSFDGLESSLLLASDFWSRLEGAVPGELVVGVPARDVVIVTGSQSGAGMEKVRRCVERVFFANGDHPLSRGLLVRRGGSWEPFDRPAGQGGRRGVGPAHQLGVHQPPRQYQDHDSWPGERVRPVSAPADRRRPPMHPAANPRRPAAAANPVRPAGPPFGSGAPLGTGAPLGAAAFGAAAFGAGPSGRRPAGPVTNHGGPMTNHGTGRGHGGPQRPMPRPAEVAQHSAMPYSAVPYSGMPYSAVPQSAVPHSAMPYSAAPYPTSSASSYVPSPQLRSAPSYERPSYDTPTYDKPLYDKPSYDKPSHRKGGYDEPAYDQPQYDGPKPAYRDDRYSTGSQPSYRDHGYGSPSSAPTSDAGSGRPEYPASWGWAPEQSASRPEWKSSPRARFSSR
jgi:Protein of unknown function (DUF1444)